MSGRNYLSLSANTTHNSKREYNTSRPPVTPRTPVPKTPLPWIWICHKCRHSYPFRATPRCLSCSHRFCGKCTSELDYSGWMVYDRYWSRKTDSAVVAKRRCVWVTEETRKQDLSCEINSADGREEEYENYRFEVGTERNAEEQERNREKEDEEERIWLEWQSADFDTESRQSHVVAAANKTVPIESSTSSTHHRSRKRSLSINTEGIVDVALICGTRAELVPITTLWISSISQ